MYLGGDEVGRLEWRECCFLFFDIFMYRLYIFIYRFFFINGYYLEILLILDF